MTATDDDLPPVPSTQRHDADGRLIGLSFDSEPPPVPDGKIWLIAVDGSRYSQQAVAEAIRLVTDSPDSRLQLVHVQHWMSREGAENELGRRGWAATRAARRAIEAAGQSWRLHIVMGDCAGSILRIAGEQGCRGIVIGSRGLGATASVLIGSVAEAVIQHSPLPVLIAGRTAAS